MCFSFTVFNRIIGMVYAHFFLFYFTTNLDLIYFWFCLMCVDLLSDACVIFVLVAVFRWTEQHWRKTWKDLVWT